MRVVPAGITFCARTSCNWRPALGWRESRVAQRADTRRGCGLASGCGLGLLGRALQLARQSILLLPGLLPGAPLALARRLGGLLQARAARLRVAFRGGPGFTACAHTYSQTVFSSNCQSVTHLVHIIHRASACGVLLVGQSVDAMISLLHIDQWVVFGCLSGIRELRRSCSSTPYCGLPRSARRSVRRGQPMPASQESGLVSRTPTVCVSVFC